MATVRLFKEVGEYLYLALLWMRRHGYEPNNIIADFKDNEGRGLFASSAELELGTVVWKKLCGMDWHHSRSNDDFIQELTQQLQRSGHGGNTDGEVIEQVAALLCMAFPRNRLDTGTVAQLRRLLLAPEEIAEVRTVLTHRETHCAGCKRLLCDREAVTFVRGGDGRGVLDGSALFCGSCVTPDFIASGCHENHWAPIPHKLYSKLRKTDSCAQCAEERQGTAAPQVAEAQAGGYNPFHEARAERARYGRAITWADVERAAGTRNPFDNTPARPQPAPPQPARPFRIIGDRAVIARPAVVQENE